MSNEAPPKAMSPDSGWYLKALEEDGSQLTREILRFLMELEGQGYSPETIGRVLGPIFGLYIRDHIAGNRAEIIREMILSSLPETMRPELIDGLVKRMRG